MSAGLALLQNERGGMVLKLAVAIAVAALAAYPQRALSAIDHAKNYWESVWSFTAV